MCELLQELRDLYSRVSAHGREVPFNNLKIKPRSGFKECLKASGCDGLAHRKLPSQINLKHLEISCRYYDDSKYNQDSIKSLVLSRSSEIQYLKIRRFYFLKEILVKNSLNFPKLQVLTIADLPDKDEFIWHKPVLSMLQAKSPNLNKIYVDNVWNLDVVPEEQYGLLGNLKLFLNVVFHEHSLYPAIVAKKPKLRELSICEIVEGNAENVRQNLRGILTQLFQSCQDSLEELNVYNYDSHTLPLLSVNALKKLSILTLQTDDSDKIEEIWNSLASIGSAKMMPKLKDIVLGMKLRPGNYIEELREWPPILNEENLIYSYGTVCRLVLDVQCLRYNMADIGRVFPHLNSLELTLNRSEHVPCREVWETWPNLQELKVRGTCGTLEQNYDAEFCGIHEEEAELLRGMDDEYLRNVQIVPIRPSLLTMRCKFLELFVRGSFVILIHEV